MTDELELQEQHEAAEVASMFATLQPHVDAYLLDQDNADSFESLKGPVESKIWVDIEDVPAEQEEEEVNWKALKAWYFKNIDDLRSLLQAVRRNAKKGYPLYVRDLVSVKLQLAKLDSMAEDAGWDFILHPTTAYERLAHEFELAEPLTVEYRACAIAKEKATRAAYLISVGIRVKEVVTL